MAFPVQQLTLDFGLTPLPSLANFMAAGNEAALDHLQLWVGNPLRSPVPTYLWGDSGCGKTHLLRAVALELQGQGARTGWLDADTWHPPAFDDDWVAVFMDDCHLFTADQQAVAFNWFVNAQSPAHGRARWVLATGACPPTDLRLRDDLRTRLGWGAVFQLHVLDDAGRRAVLRRAADDRGVHLTDDVMAFLLTRFSRDLSSLMHLLDLLDAYALRTQRPLTIPLVKSMLENT